MEQTSIFGQPQVIAANIQPSHKAAVFRFARCTTQPPLPKSDLDSGARRVHTLCVFTHQGRGMKRLTVDLEDKKHAEFKSKAAAQGMTMRDVLKTAIDEYLAGRFKPSKAVRGKHTSTH